MTIAISLKVNEGVVLAADSASTLFTQVSGNTLAVVNVYNNADKVFNLIKGRPVGTVTWGAGSIGMTSIATLMKDLRRRLTGDDLLHRESWKIDPDSYTILDVAQKVRQFMYEEHYLAASQSGSPNHPLGFVVAGYSTNQDMAEEYQIDISDGSCNAPRSLRGIQESGIVWNGQGEAIHRLIVGFGGSMSQVLQNNLGVPIEQLEPTLNILRQTLTYPLIAPAMPIQDAIDLAEFLVDLTIKFSHFAPGASTVGGPIEIAAITKHEHFKWIRRKYYYNRELNPEERETMDQYIGGTVNVGNAIYPSILQGQDAPYNFQPLLVPAGQGPFLQLRIGPLVQPNTAVPNEEAADTRRRLSSFEEDWNAPGMNLYDAL